MKKGVGAQCYDARTMTTRLKKLSAKEAVLLERHSAAIGAARDRLGAVQNAANAALRSVCPEIARHEGSVDTEEDGDDMWLVVRAIEKPRLLEDLPLAPVEAGDGGNGEAGMRTVAAEVGGEATLDRAVRPEKP